MTETSEDQLSCQELVELVTEYLEGAMAPDARARFEEHIAMCEGCRTYVDQLRDMLARLGTLTPEHLSPEAQRELRLAFREWSRG